MASGDKCTYLAFPLCSCPFEVQQDAFSFLTNEKGIHTGFRHHRYYTELVTGAFIATWDFIDPVTHDFLYIARADCMPDLFQVILEGSDDNIAFPTQLFFNFPITLTGPRDEDFFECFDETAAHRYWRVRLVSVPSAQLCFSKIYFGKLFDMGREPSTDFTETREPSRRSNFRTTSSKRTHARVEHPSYTFELEYNKITNDKALEFMDLVSFWENRFVLLVNTQFQELLNSHEVIHGRMSDIEISRETDNGNDISFTIEEMVG